MESFTISLSTIFVGLLMITTILVCSCCYCTDIWLSKKNDKSLLGEFYDEDLERDEKKTAIEMRNIESSQNKNSALLKEHNCSKHINPVIFQYPSPPSLNGHANNSDKKNCIHNYTTKFTDYIEDNKNSMWRCNQEEAGKSNTASTSHSNCSRTSHTITSSLVTTPNTNQKQSRSPSPTSGSQKAVLPAVILPITCLIQSHPPHDCHGKDCIYRTKDYLQLGKLKTDTDDIGVSEV
uniref:Uncharacterized protein n=1 Tax=Strongyloides papillosus TaxID=174720 RepID=A0A0N5CC04_STREA